MNEDFELPVNINGNEKIFRGKFLRTGYSYKIEIETGDEVLLFEPDEERNWRAVLLSDTKEASRNIQIGIYQSIADALDRVFRVS
ncbi:MAG: hypothetical protein ACJ75F_08125 [Flavisolibacter sp.]|jgi:hypothetical protein